MAALLEPAGSVGAAGQRAFAREDLHEFMHRSWLAETPFLSLCGTDKDIGKVQFDWNVDKPATAQGAVGRADGQDVSTYENAFKDRRRMGNLGQVFERTAMVGFIAESIGSTPGVSSEMAESVMKKMGELKTDIEAGMCSLDQLATDDGGTSTTGSTTSGLGALTDRTNSNSSLTTITAGKIPSTYLPPAAANLGGASVNYATGAISGQSALSAANFGEADLRAALLALRGVAKTSRSYVALVGTSIRASVNAFLTTTSGTTVTIAGVTEAVRPDRIRMSTRQEMDTTIQQMVDIFRDTNGELHFVTSNLIGRTTTTDGSTWTATQTSRVFSEDTKGGYILAKELWKARYGKMTKVTDLPDAGGGPRKVIRAYAGLYCQNPSLSGRIWYS